MVSSSLGDAFFNPKVKTQAALHAALNPAFDRFKELDEEKQELFRKDAGSFVRLYEFLSQIVAYDDPELEKLFVYTKHLQPRLAEHAKSELLALDSAVRLTHYRLQKLGEQALDLEKGEVVKLKPTSETGTGAGAEDERKALREIVQTMNDLFAGNITEDDLVGAAAAWTGRLMRNEELAAEAKANSEEQFVMGSFQQAFEDVVIEAKDAQNSIADQLLKNEKILGAIAALVAKAVWRQHQGATWAA